MILMWTEEQAMKGWPGRAMVSCGRQTTPTITFLLQEDKLLLYKKVKLVGVVCLPTIHRCLKSVHRLPEFYKLLI